MLHRVGQSAIWWSKELTLAMNPLLWHFHCKVTYSWPLPMSYKHWYQFLLGNKQTIWLKYIINPLKWILCPFPDLLKISALPSPWLPTYDKDDFGPRSCRIKHIILLNQFSCFREICVTFYGELVDGRESLIPPIWKVRIVWHDYKMVGRKKKWTPESFYIYSTINNDQKYFTSFLKSWAEQAYDFVSLLDFKRGFSRKARSECAQQSLPGWPATLSQKDTKYLHQGNTGWFFCWLLLHLYSDLSSKTSGWNAWRSPSSFNSHSKALRPFDWVQGTPVENQGKARLM